MKEESVRDPNIIVSHVSRASPLIDGAPLAMVEVEGPNHVICFVNAAFCHLLDKPLEDLVGKPFALFVQNAEKCVGLLDLVYESGRFGTQAKADVSVTNPTFWLNAMWPASGPEKPAERVVIQLTQSARFNRDIAAMNEALLISGLRQHELREESERVNTRSRVEIADQVLTEGKLRGVNDQLRSASVADRAATDAKDVFLAQLSHELRTPLTPVLIAAARMLEDPRLPEDMLQQLRMIERNVTLEARLIDDLLDLTKISSGKLYLRSEPCDVHSLIGLAIEIVRDEAKVKGITIVRDFTADHSGLRADPTRIQQVVWNLLRNAVKFTPRGGTISVRTSHEATNKIGRWLRIEVKDSGIGIAADSLKSIFLPFDQGPLAGDQRFGGVGLGLAIAQSVVVLHGGRIVAVSPGANRGSTFIVELPGAVEPELGASDEALPHQELKRAKPTPLRLLLVEDHAETLKNLAHLLRTDGHTVSGADTIADALAVARTHTFDLVISDLGLPDGTGMELMEQLRSKYGLRGIALSGYGMEDDVVRSHAAGFVTHLVKPVAIAELRRVVALLGLQKMSRGQPKPPPQIPDNPSLS